MTNEKIVYYNTNRVVDEGGIVITTKNPSDKFYRACSSVDRERYILAGVLITGAGQLCAMDVTKQQDLETFVSSVGRILFFKPAGGVVFKLPNEKAKELRTSYEKASIQDVNKARALVGRARMGLTDGIMTGMSFSPRGELHG